MPELIYCAARQADYARIAIAYGYTYGASMPSSVYFAPQFIDHAPDAPPPFDVYMQALETYRPRLASVMDWFTEDQFDDVMRWATGAAQHVTEAIIIVPKVFGGISKLPRTINGRQVRLGYSVPTLHGATSVPLWEFAGWPVHLLGGQPHHQHSLASYPSLDVRSVDGNYSQLKANKFVEAFSPLHKWITVRDVYERIEWDAPAAAWTLSCINIRAMWLEAPTFIRWALEKDLPAIKRIAGKYRNELGYVMLPALRESIDRRTLYVATDSAGNVQGFVNSRTRKDGMHVIYEIAVSPEWRGKRIGAALLNAVPHPKRLKVTQDNEAAIQFYEGAGMSRVGQEAGKKRALFVYETAAPVKPLKESA